MEDNYSKAYKEVIEIRYNWTNEQEKNLSKNIFLQYQKKAI